MYYKLANKLLRSLVGQLCSHQRQTGADSRMLPKESLVVIAQQWRADPSKDLDADILSLLENTSEEDGLSLLLNICCEPLIESLLKGHECKLDVDKLSAACKVKSVDVSAIVIDNLESMAMTPMAIELVKLGYVTLNPCEESTFGYIRRTFEHVLHRLTSMASSDAVAKGVYEGLAAMVRVITGFAWPQLHPETVRDFVLAMLLNNMANAAAIQFTGTLIKLVYQMASSIATLYSTCINKHLA